MRVIAGRARGRPLRPPRGAPTRPTSDRVKEALFSMIEALLAHGTPDAEIGTEELWCRLRVLDIYAGSGALGIEALSRGASGALFLEADTRAAAAIRTNLAATDLAAGGDVHSGEVRRLLPTVAGPVDVVLMDPPYVDPDALGVARLVAEAPWLAEDALLAFEHSQRLATPATLGTLKLQRRRRYGDTALSLYARGRYDRGTQEGD